MSDALSKVSVIIDGEAPSDQIRECISSLGTYPGQFEVLVAGGPAQLEPAQHVLCEGSVGERWNEAAKKAKGDYLFFLKPWVLLNPGALAILAESLEREMEIGACAPLLVQHDGSQAPQEFILLEDECKRRPIDVLLRPVKFGYRPDWQVSPVNGVAYLADAILVRKVAFWGAGGWDGCLENHWMDLTLGLSISELQWRVTCDYRAVGLTADPASDLAFDVNQSIKLVDRWYGRFLPHGLRTSDGVIRHHPWIPIHIGAVLANYQRTPSIHNPRPSGTCHRPGEIPGERCSVVVVTYNSMSSLTACVTSVIANLGTFDELILVDNGSRDDTPNYLQSLEGTDPRIKIVLNGANLGFSEGCNVGIRESCGDYIVLLNPDTVVTEGWLGRMRAYFQDPSVGAVGPISNGAYGMQSYSFHFPRNAGDELSPGDIYDLATKVNARRSVDVRLLIGFCVMIPRTILDEVGHLDPELFLGFDDLDLSWRLRLAGYRLLIASDVFVLHRVHVSFMSEPESVTKEHERRSANAFARKLIAHYGEGAVPDQMEIWGIDWFTPEVEVWAKAA